MLTATGGVFARLRKPLATPLSAAHSDIILDGAPPAETLYNGIRLPRPWPPVRHSLSLEPTTPPYLDDPPAIIPIDIGRQLFVDDFLIEENLLTRTYHLADYYAHNPVVRPTTAWEKLDEYAIRTNTRSNPTAMVFSDGVFYDAADRLFKMWYMGGLNQNTCYAYSPDGLNWTKPPLDVLPPTNVVMHGLRDSNTVWLDENAARPIERFKMSSFDGSERVLHLLVSPDGIHWQTVGRSGPVGDRTTFFFNPFRGVWVFSIRDQNADGSAPRRRRYWECRDFAAGAHWAAGEPVLWTGADDADPRRPEYNVPPELYNLDAVAYESLLIGLFSIWRGERDFREKPNDIVVGYSRDGFHWYRPDRRPFIGVSERVGDWNWANVQSAGGVCLVVGDRLHFYVSGRQGVPGTSAPGICSTGLATLRRDGFASLSDIDAGARVRRIFPASAGRSITTRPVRFSGRFLFVNADAANGSIAVEVLDQAGKTIPPFTAANCRAVSGDGSKMMVSWTRGDLRELAGEVVRFRFNLTRARLYAFWVSPSMSGVSRGYVGAGGPAFRTRVDSDA